MSGNIITKIIAMTVIASTAFMYQETPAQRKPRVKAQKATEKTAQAAPPEIAYTIGMSRPATHLLEVEMNINWQAMPAQLEVKMPVWTPGSYLIREYARHVQDLEAADAGGKQLAWRKLNKNTWQIDTDANKAVTIKYKVYANELTVRTNELNDEHAFWNNAATLMFVKDNLKARSTVSVKPFGKWKVATGLPPVSGKPNTFTAENYDILYDSPFEVSDHKEVSFTVENVPHRIVFSGDGNYDMERTAKDIAKIIEQAFKIFGELPYKDYTFIVNLRGGGGLEHLNSTALQFNRFGFKPDSRYKSFLGLAAHEYFHAFNVKRIRPDALGPFDYENENYTRMLWVAEGGTEYYSNLLLVRAGLITPKEFLDARADGIEALQARPGRLEQSLEDSSFDAWIKYYRPDENAINNQISYYDKGEIVNMMLDITIREASGGARSLDDVMRSLYNDHYKQGKNYTPADFQKIAEAAAGRSLDDFFKKYVRGTDDIDYAAIFAGIGLDVTTSGGKSDRGYIGFDLSETNGSLTIRSIPAGSPAYDQGLNTGDQVVAIDGYRASTAFLQSYLSDKRPGDKVRLTFFRFDRLRDIDFTLGKDGLVSYMITPLANMSEAQEKLLAAWLPGEE